MNEEKKDPFKSAIFIEDTEDLTVKIIKDLIESDVIRVSSKDLYNCIKTEEEEKLEQRNALTRALSMFSTEDILKVLMQSKMSRKINEATVGSVIDFITRRTTTLFKLEDDTSVELESTDVDELTRLVNLIPIVSKANVIAEDLPHQLSLIIKLSTQDFEETEIQNGMNAIDNIIDQYKDLGVDEVEVIFHNKVVY